MKPWTPKRGQTVRFGGHPARVCAIIEKNGASLYTVLTWRGKVRRATLDKLKPERDGDANALTDALSKL